MWLRKRKWTDVRERELQYIMISIRFFDVKPIDIRTKLMKSDKVMTNR